MLVVGSSGSGKSNFLYAVITSLVFNRSPENLKLLFIATNETEFTAFCGLPHLIAEPVQMRYLYKFLNRKEITEYEKEHFD